MSDPLWDDPRLRRVRRHVQRTIYTRAPCYRLMKLAASGRRDCYATGSLVYLMRLAQRATRTRGRQWIELSTEPAIVRSHAGGGIGVIGLDAQGEPIASLSEAARIAGVHVNTVRGWMRKGKVKCLRTAGGSPRIVVASLFRQA